jgi:adenylate cyclase
MDAERIARTMNPQPNTGFVRTEQREVTLLFADMRGFTELAASLEVVPIVCELLGHVMDYLTEAVVKQHGHIVDYYGDGLVAMWNAPTNQPEHASLACRAALRMLESLPEVAADWAGLVENDLRLGIGVHTATVQVGNAGSKQHVKYGPRGPSVHVASRVEAATKELQVPFIATRSTVKQLSPEFTANRVCRASLPGLQRPVDLFAVQDSSNAGHLADSWRQYSEALQYFEAGQYQQAADALATLGPSAAEVPLQFLSEQLQRELSREFRRRSTDKPAAAHQGVITISAK